MSGPDVLWLALTVGGFVVAVIVAIVAIFAGAGWLGDAVSGVHRLRARLIQRGVDERLVRTIVDELNENNPGPTMGILATLLGIPALGYGLYALRGIYAPELEEFLLYPAPGLLALTLGVVLLLRARVQPDRSPTHRALITRAAEVRELEPTRRVLNINVTTAGEALTGLRASQRIPIPHLIVRLADGTEHTIRAFHDQDHGSVELLRAVTPLVPHARIVQKHAPSAASAPDELAHA